MLHLSPGFFLQIHRHTNSNSHTLSQAAEPPVCLPNPECSLALGGNRRQNQCPRTRKCLVGPGNFERIGVAASEGRQMSNWETMDQRMKTLSSMMGALFCRE